MRIYTSSMTNTRFVEHDITFKKDNHRENLKIRLHTVVLHVTQPDQESLDWQPAASL